MNKSLLTFTLLCLAYANADWTLFFEKVSKCQDTNEDYINIKDVKVSRHNRTTMVMKGHAIINKDLPRSSMIQIQMQTLKRGKWENLSLMIPKVELCSYVKSDKKYYPMILDYSDLPRECPFRQGKYYIENAHFEYDNRVQVLPAGCYRTFVRISNMNEELYCFQMIGKIVVGKGEAIPRCVDQARNG